MIQMICSGTLIRQSVKAQLIEILWNCPMVFYAWQLWAIDNSGRCAFQNFIRGIQDWPRKSSSRTTFPSSSTNGPWCSQVRRKAPQRICVGDPGWRPSLSETKKLSIRLEPNRGHVSASAVGPWGGDPCHWKYGVWHWTKNFRQINNLLICPI